MYVLQIKNLITKINQASVQTGTLISNEVLAGNIYGKSISNDSTGSIWSISPNGTAKFAKGDVVIDDQGITIECGVDGGGFNLTSDGWSCFTAGQGSIQTSSLLLGPMTKTDTHGYNDGSLCINSAKGELKLTSTTFTATKKFDFSLNGQKTYPIVGVACANKDHDATYTGLKPGNAILALIINTTGSDKITVKGTDTSGKTIIGEREQSAPYAWIVYNNGTSLEWIGQNR